MQHFSLRSVLFLMVLVCFSWSAKAQQISESTVNSEYRSIILDHLKTDVAQRQAAMQQKAESMLLALPNGEKLYDETEVKVKARLADGIRDDGKAELNYVMELSYNSKNIEGESDDYPSGVYLLERSNSARALCNILRVLIDEECTDLFAPGKRVSIRIASSADAVELKHLDYLGEYGDHRYIAALYNGEQVRLSLLQDEGINTNAQLAFARAQGVRDFIDTKVHTLQNNAISYSYITRTSSEKGSQYRRCSIEITVHSAFDETILSMNEKLINDDYIEYNIPLVAPGTNKKTYVLIIANERYDAPLPNCEYAWRDGMVVRDYCVRTLGIPERHVRVLHNASYDDIKVRGVKWLTDILAAVDGDANILLYYAGHGLSDADYVPYIVPSGLNVRVVKGWNGITEIDPDALLSKRETNALLSECLSLDTLCSWFNRIPVNAITFILDAPFNGNQRNGEVLVPIAHNDVRLKDLRVREDIVIFAPCPMDKTAYSFSDQKHGFLTYFLMKELKRTKGNINYGTLFENMQKAVKYESSLEGKLQEPQMILGGKMKDGWEGYRFR